MPYGYVMTNSKTMKFDVDEPAAQVVRDIFEKYNEGWGYKKLRITLQKNIYLPLVCVRRCEKRRTVKSASVRQNKRGVW